MAKKPDATVLYELVRYDLEKSSSADVIPQFRAARSSMLDKYLSKFREVPKSQQKIARYNAEKEVWRCNMKCASHFENLQDHDVPVWFEYLLGHIRDDIKRLLEDSDGEICFSQQRPGPGTSNDVKGTSYYEKVHGGHLTFVSTFQERCYKSGMAAAPWSQREEVIRQARYGSSISTNEKLSFVAKNSQTMRPISIQSAASIATQLCVGRFFERRLKRWGIDISVQQDIHRSMVLTKDICTIDLKSASSLWSVKAVMLLLEPKWFRLLDSLRAQRIQSGERSFPSHTFSAMGNGFTFPLETILFAAIVRACYRLFGVPLIQDGPNRNYSVFGDDIIVVKDVYDQVVRALTTLGLEVNSNKSFKEGPFRESCGVDAYEGVDIRPVYLKYLTTTQDLYVAFNSLANYYRRWGVYSCEALKYLLTEIRKREGTPRGVSLACDVAAGIQLPIPLLDHKLLRSFGIDILAKPFGGANPSRFQCFVYAFKYHHALQPRVTANRFDRPDLQLSLILSGTQRDERWVSWGRPNTDRPRYEIRRRVLSEASCWPLMQPKGLVILSSVGYYQWWTNLLVQ